MPRALAVVAAFEMRQQLRSGVFVVVFLLSFMMVLGSVSVDQLRVGLSEMGLRNGPEAIVRTHLVWTLFFLFTSAAFVTDAVLRDDLTGFGPIIWSTPLRRRDYLLGRFTGSFLAVVVCFTSVPFGLVVGSVMPWVDQTTVGAFEPAAYAIALVVFSLPNLFLSSAVAFGLATLFRSLTAAFLGAVALLVFYGIGEHEGLVRHLSALLEPFGFASFAQDASGFEAGKALHLSPLLIANRMLWCGFGAALVALPFLYPVLGRRETARPPRAEQAGPLAMPATFHLPPPRFGWATTLVQLQVRTRLEINAIVWTETFGALLVLGAVSAAASLWSLHGPTTDTVILTLFAKMQVLPTVVVLFFSGQLIWREHELNLAGLLGATPASDPVLMIPKLLALLLVLASLAAAGALAGVLIQALQAAPIHVIAYVTDWFWPATFDWCLLAVLAVFLQALAPNKLAGWGLFVLFLVASLAADRLGFSDPRYRFGQHPGWPLPAQLSGQPSIGTFRVYWGSVSLCLALIGAALVGRTPEPLLARLCSLPARLSRMEAVMLTGGLLTFLGAGLALW